MTRLGCLAVVALTVMPGLAAAAPSRGVRAKVRGKVIRIERERSGTTTPRVCDIRGDRGGTCLGSEPQLGERVTVLDESGVLAEVEIVEAIAFSTGGPSACQSLWNIKTELIRGDLASIPMRTIGVVDPQLHARKARMLAKDQFPTPPSGRNDEQVVVAIDRDGDHAADIVLTQNQCESSPIPGGSCIDEWARVGGRLVLVQQTNFATCGF